MNIILIWVKKVKIFGFTAYMLDIVAVVISLFLIVAIIRSAIKNLRKLDKEERAQWASKADDEKPQPEDWT
jgi:hypothetical protein